jgi:hypothetical protein
MQFLPVKKSTPASKTEYIQKYTRQNTAALGGEGFISIDKSLESKEIINRISKIPPKVPPSKIDWGL